ncbi:MAG: hypothetical protein KBB77_00835 [Candidatus Moranbacteria bacterium]|nr:hypothetical protein [Candidatus Moranbacteria bacterium]
MQKQQTRTRGRKPTPVQTFPVNIDGHQIAMTREQVIANGQGWKRCHGEHDGTKVNSLSIKRIGDKVFIKDGGKMSGFDVAELAVALPEIQGLIGAKGTAISQ